jgi:hypothetical protein
VYAFIGTGQFTETNEMNNISPPLVVTDVMPIEPVPLTAVTLIGALTGEVGVAYAFTAVVTPISATQPITYIWQASHQDPITQTGGLADTVTFNWAVTGTQTITVTAMNEAGEMVTAVHTITISAPPNLPQHILYLPFAAAAKP